MKESFKMIKQIHLKMKASFKQIKYIHHKMKASFMKMSKIHLKNKASFKKIKQIHLIKKASFKKNTQEYFYPGNPLGDKDVCLIYLNYQFFPFCVCFNGTYLTDLWVCSLKRLCENVVLHL